MDTQLDHFITYTNEALGINVLPKLWDKAATLPLFLKERYQFYHLEMLSVQCILAVDIGINGQTPASIEKQIIQLAAKTDKFFIYSRGTINSYDRKRLIERKIPFIIPGNQMYLPFLGVDLREYFRNVHRKSEKLSPAAQRLLLYLLQKACINGTTPAKMAEQLGYTNMTMTRAFQELENIGIGYHEKAGRNKLLYLKEDKKIIWDKALPFLQSPVQKKLYVRKPVGANDFSDSISLAGQSALAFMSMLAEPNIPAYAIQGKLWKGHLRRLLEVLPHPEPDAIELELWNYSVHLPDEKNIVDRLSLYLSMKDNTDERIQGALNNVLKECLW